MKINFDVAIVGGGPAGAAAALTLLKYSSLNVAVLERSDYGQVRIGETIPPGVQPLLGYLGIWEAFLEEGHLPAYSSCAAWGSSEVVSRHFLFTGRGEGWHLDRQRFDRMLAREVEKRGGKLLSEARLVACRHDADELWQLGVRQKDGTEVDLRARFVIDASGKKFVFARRCGARQQVYDDLTGVIGFYKFDDDEVRPHVTLVETCAEGWWYSSLLPDRRMAIAFMSDTDIIRQRRLLRPHGWSTLLEQSKHTQARVQGGRLSLPLHVRPAYSRLLHPSGDKGWIAAGDAAASFDPLSSMGIGHALTSGIHAARAAHAALASDDQLVHQYASNMRRNFHQYLSIRRQYYLLERRWNSIFWARRHAAPASRINNTEPSPVYE
jgi:flavin-dependent dehydrogenase